MAGGVPVGPSAVGPGVKHKTALDIADKAIKTSKMGREKKNQLFLLQQGSSPSRGRSPVEWGEILSVHLSLDPSFCLCEKCRSEGLKGLRAS